MSQNYHYTLEDMGVNGPQLKQYLHDNFLTIITQWADETPPANPAQGQPWLDISNGWTDAVLKFWNGTEWVPQNEYNPYIKELKLARQDKSTLWEFLDVAHNPDGTLKSDQAENMTEWVDSALTPTYVSSTEFKVSGDQTDIFVANRKVKATLDASVEYSDIKSTSYDSVNDETSVVVFDAVLDSTLQKLEYGLVKPGSDGSLARLIATIVFFDDANVSFAAEEIQSAIEKLNISSNITIDDTNISITTNQIQDAIEKILNNYKAGGNIDLNGYDLINVNDIKKTGQVYGLEWNQTRDSYTRLEDAQGLSVPDAQTAGYKYSDFDDIYPWSGMRRCNLADDGTVNAYYGDPTYTTDGSNGQVMVEIPKFYWKREVNTTGDRIFRWYISAEPKTGFEVHPAFIRNGVEKDYIYIGAFGAYNNGGILESKSGVQPTANQTRDTFRTQAEARGTGWTQQDGLTVGCYQTLYLVEYGDFNSQQEIGKGIVDKASGTGNESELTGATSSNLSYGDPGDGYTAVSYRGIENPWGNIWKFVDGIVVKDDGYYWTDDITAFNDTGSGYNHIAITPLTTSSDGYVDNIEADVEFLLVAKSISGTSTTYLADNCWPHDSGEVNIARVGGAWNDGFQAGVGCLYLYDVASYSNRDLSARLLKI